MKQIQPIQSWVNGQSVTATQFYLYPTIGQLFISSNFCYQLLDEAGTVVAKGNLLMEGEAYQSWGNNDDYAYQWGADQLNITLA
jgi:hypothetical protein